MAQRKRAPRNKAISVSLDRGGIKGQAQISDLTERMKSSRARRLTLVAAMAGSVAAIVAAAVLLRAESPGPRDVVDEYLAAIVAGDYKRAFDSLSSRSQESVGQPTNLKSTSVATMFATGIGTEYSIDAADTNAPDRSTVAVRVSGMDRTVTLKIAVIKESDTWRIEL